MRSVIVMSVLLGDVKNKFDLLNTTLDNAVNDWVEFHKPILTNFETTKRMFAPNNQWEWVQDAYREWVNKTSDELNQIATENGFKFIDDGFPRKTFSLEHTDLETLIEESLGKLRLYYNYDFGGGNRSLEKLLENVATVKFSLTKRDIFKDEVLKSTLEMFDVACDNVEKVFRVDDMRDVYTKCQDLLNDNVKHCAAYMRPIYQHDFEFIMDELESLQKYDSATELVNKILQATDNGNFDSWYGKTIANHESVDVIHDMEIEMQNLASELGLDVWFI